MTLNKVFYDGLFFYPQFEEEQHVDYKIELFEFNDKRNSKVQGTEVGDLYLIAFFKSDSETVIKLDDNFEAIFVDPLTYIKNLIGSKLYGIMVKKTKKSEKWFKGMLKNLKEKDNGNKLG
jgi:hypothetical protein